MGRWEVQRLSGVDSAFLSLETPTNHMHVCMVSTFDATAMPGGYSFEKVRDHIANRLGQLPEFRRRPVGVPFGLHFPIWVQDPGFDLDYHVRRMAVPSPGGIRELATMASDFAGRQLDRTKPLWEIYVVEGVGPNIFGLLAKVHHSSIDGVSGAETMVHLFDLEPKAAEPAPIEDPPEFERIPNDWELVAHAARSLARQPLQLARILPAATRSVRDLVRLRRDPASPNMPAPFSAPRTPFSGSVTAHRSVAGTRLSLQDVKAVRRAFGVTVNDVILALCGGALRNYLLRRACLPETSLVAVVPVSVRGTEGVEGANQISAMFASIGTHLADPGARLAHVSATTRSAKEEHQAIGATTLTDWAQFAAPAVFSMASRAYTSMKLADRHRPIHNLVISNVPGPPFPLYLGGAKLTMLSPLGPVMEGAGLNITVLSYMDAIDVGLISCRELVPDLWDLARDFDVAMAELSAAAQALAPDPKGKGSGRRRPAKPPGRAGTNSQAAGGAPTRHTARAAGGAAGAATAKSA
ncbi:MAG: WS/DGAT/MGAT family O-acyltransferase [Acidimicrobiales bacterium]